MRTFLKITLALSAAVLVTAVVVQISAQPREMEKKQEGQQVDKRFEVQITDEMIRHSRILDTLYFVGTGWSLGALALLLLSGASRRMRDWAAKITKVPYLMAMVYIVFFTIALSLLSFPLAYYSGFMVPHEFSLSSQSLASWLGDWAKGLAVSLVMSSVLGALALLGIRRVRRWWLVLWAVSIPIIILIIVIQPIVLDPIFNKFEPLKDQQLRNDLLDLASRAGIEGSRVYQVNRSKQTNTMNAYVNGIGPTNRIVIWDTTLDKMTHDELMAVMGHEMGHYVMHDVWKSLAFGMVVSFVVFFLVQTIHDRGLRRWGPRWGFSERGDPASVPWLLLIASVILFFFSPVDAAYSRSIEHKADIFSLELTHLNEPMATAFVKLAENSKRNPYPNAFLELWIYSHPPISKRIPFALSYKPWEKGAPNQAWKP